MKKIVAAFLFILSILCTGCTERVRPSELSFAGMYPDLCPYQQNNLSAERREALRQSAQTVLDNFEECTDENSTIGIKEQWVEINLRVSDEWVKTEPDNWESIKERAFELAEELSTAAEDQNIKSVLYLSDKRFILFTAIDGEMVFDKFNRQKHYEPPAESDRERIDEILQSAAQRREESGEQGVSYFEPDNEIVYVSDNSNTIHSIPDCSGMVHYSEMFRSEADGYGYEYCENCW